LHLCLLAGIFQLDFGLLTLLVDTLVDAELNIGFRPHFFNFTQLDKLRRFLLLNLGRDDILGNTANSGDRSATLGVKYRIRDRIFPENLTVLWLSISASISA